MDYAIHPGSVMKSLLISMGKRQKWLASQMNMSKVVISELVNGKRSVTPRIALEFEKATGYPAKYLLNTQVDYDLFNERKKMEETESKETVNKYNINSDIVKDL